MNKSREKQDDLTVDSIGYAIAMDDTELRSVHGGNAMGLVTVAKLTWTMVKASIEGAYQRGYDDAQSRCGCNS